jgi:GTP-binding protein Era
MSFQSGFVALVGKPNVGKSTLVNRLVGRKVAITSAKPQTTRQRMLGVFHGSDFQAVLVDTPGMMLAKSQLHKKMNVAASQEARQADLVLWLAEATHLPTDEDKRVGKLLRDVGQEGRPVWLVLTKIDKAKEGVAAAYAQLFPEAAKTFQLSAKSGAGVPDLLKELVAALPEGPMFFPADQVTEQNERLWLAEIVREKVLSMTRQEVPHAVAVTVEELRPAEGGGDGLYGRAILYVEKESQKRILVGKNGDLLKRVGTESRKELEKAWGRPLYLDLWVKVKEDWREREDWLRIFGY